MSNLTIKPGKATEDVKEIYNIISSIDVAMKELDEAIDKIIPERVETEWSNKFKEDWKHYYDGSVRNVMEEMKQSAIYLQEAVDKSVEYSES